MAVLTLAPRPFFPDSGKDTGRFRRAGARITALAAPGWLQLTYADPQDPQFPSLSRALALLEPCADLVLLDGDNDPWPRVLFNPFPGAMPESPAAEVLAVVGDPPPGWTGPRFEPEETDLLGALLLTRLELAS